MENIKDCTLIRNKSLEKTCCANCKLSKSYSTHYRYRIHYKSKEQVEELLYNAYADLRMQGYQPCKIIYMMKKVIRKNGEDIMILDTLLPLED